MVRKSKSAFGISSSERLHVMEDVWEDRSSNSKNSTEIPVPAWRDEELERRKSNLMSNPAAGLTWNEVIRRVRRRFGR